MTPVDGARPFEQAPSGGIYMSEPVNELEPSIM
jgi:hypothetical protein